MFENCNCDDLIAIVGFIFLIIVALDLRSIDMHDKK
jgi:hypothetical protein